MTPKTSLSFWTLQKILQDCNLLRSILNATDGFRTSNSLKSTSTSQTLLKAFRIVICWVPFATLWWEEFLTPGWPWSWRTDAAACEVQRSVAGERPFPWWDPNAISGLRCNEQNHRNQLDKHIIDLTSKNCPLQRKKIQPRSSKPRRSLLAWCGAFFKKFSRPFFDLSRKFS